MSERKAKLKRKLNTNTRPKILYRVDESGLNRSQRRNIMRSNKNRLYSKKGYAFGNKIGGKLLGVAEHMYKKSHTKKEIAAPVTRNDVRLPKFSPLMTNHERHFIRRKTREQRAG